MARPQRSINFLARLYTCQGNPDLLFIKSYYRFQEIAAWKGGILSVTRRLDSTSEALLQKIQ